MSGPIPTVAYLEDLERPQLVAIAHEYMLLGMLVNRGLLPQVVLQTGGFDEMNDVAIDLWMGASPVYTARTRRLMGIEGDDIAAIMKALQLDVGFVHEYMSVAYKIIDEQHGEFWLNHCGALLDAEPFGEERVFGMCHTIEDPTFDATAYATNPRARIRPIHRPPRTPDDRHPHCHWMIVIDPENEPVGPAALTEQVAALPLASVANTQADEAAPEGMVDYRGPFVPDFRLASLSSAALAAVAREFQMQSHLLVSAAELALAARFDADVVRAMLAKHWVGVAWLTSERLADRLGARDGGAEGVAAVLRLQPDLCPGFDRAVEVDGDRVRLTLTPTTLGLLDPDHPGSPGLLARAERGGMEALAQGADRRARLGALNADADQVVAEWVVDPAASLAAEPDEVALVRMGLAGTWAFTT
jgi:hypothetical protein